MPDPAITVNDDAKKADELAAAKKATDDAAKAALKSDDTKKVDDVKKPEDILETKLTGDDVPEKFRGKTLKEILTSGKDLEAELTRAKTELGHWHTYATELDADKKKTQEPAYDPLAHLDEDTAKAVSTLIGYQMRPVLEALADSQEERVKLTRPDYDTFKDRAQEIFRELPFEYKMHPKYGLDWAYKMAKVEKEDKPGLPVMVAPPVMGPSQTGDVGGKQEPTLTDPEKYIAGKMNMTEKEYTEYKEVKDPDKMKKE